MGLFDTSTGPVTILFYGNSLTRIAPWSDSIKTELKPRPITGPSIAMFASMDWKPIFQILKCSNVREEILSLNPQYVVIQFGENASLQKAGAKNSVAMGVWGG